MKTILVPIDGSANSERALLKAKELADCLGSKIIVLNVISVRSTVSYYHFNARLAQDSMALDWPEIIKKTKADSQELLDKAKEMLGDSNVETVMLEEYGEEMARSIVNFANECGADLIVMGSNGLGSLSKRLYMGSVTTRVLHITDKPVLVIQ
ncbi:MAG: universal stress protein [Clostridiales bacterium]|nr:universal stress protein [Clostridiales bacterium]